MKLKFLEIEIIMLHLVFNISWDPEKKSGNKVLENSDLLTFLTYSKPGNIETTLKNVFWKMYSQIKEIQVNLEK